MALWNQGGFFPQKDTAYWNRNQIGQNLVWHPSINNDYFFCLCKWQMLNLSSSTKKSKGCIISIWHLVISNLSYQPYITLAKRWIDKCFNSIKGGKAWGKAGVWGVTSAEVMIKAFTEDNANSREKTLAHEKKIIYREFQCYSSSGNVHDRFITSKCVYWCRA